ncbi:MAG: sulfotransferase family protein [Herpetosiphonaceae bacterium]|nr:sulfotransferase family protein [Herpetosiphonaceae bacterium]
MNQLKIIGAGFGRTGTVSLKVALEALGFAPCYHMSEVFQNMETMLPLWEQVAAGKLTDWTSIFGNYQATVDWPTCNFYAELMQTYPDAKVLLSVRDPEQWYESARSTLYDGANQLLAMNEHLRRPGAMVTKLVWQDTFHDRFEDKAYAISVFNRHNAEVQRTVPAEKLLVYNVKEGWAPLCAFLNVPVPDGPFPHLNDRASIQRDFDKLNDAGAATQDLIHDWTPQTIGT